MLQPMHPSMDTPATGDRVAQGNRATQDDVSFESDELIIHSQKVGILEKNTERIEQIFHVVVGLGISAQEDVEMQWISIQGLPEDRAMAKSYIKALCSPGNVLSINFSDDIYATLSQPELHARLERQSNTAILFPSVGQAVIQGEDDLAVTLAVSAIEDIIQKFNDVDIPDVSSPTSTGEVSDRLDRELRRLSSQNKELYDQEFDVESLKILSGPVKRTLLKQYIDDSRQNSVEEPKAADSGYAQDPDQTVPMTLVGVESATSISSDKCFVDLHPKKKTATTKGGTSSWSAIDLHPSQNNSLSLSLHLSDTPEARKDGIVDLTDSPAQSPPVQQRKSPLGASENQNTAVQSDPPSPPIGNGNIVTEAITFALNSGYTEEEIDEVLKIYGEYLSTGQFLQALHTNRKERTQKIAVTVAELEAAHVPRPPQNKQHETSKDETDEEERAVTPTGKQQTHQTHSQGPKTKKGKISKSTPAKKQGKRANRGKHKSPNEENIDKMEVVSLSDDEEEPASNNAVQHVKPMYDMLKNSPLPGDYLERLTRDYDDEDSSDIEELRKNNTVRRALLEQALVLDKRRGQQDEEEDDEDMAEISEEEWVTAERDGRQRFPKSPSTKATEAVDDRRPKTGGAGENEKRPQKSSVKKRPVAAAAAAAAPASVDCVEPNTSHLQPGLPESAINNLDVLDDFSLPYEIQDQSDGAAGRNQLWPNRGPYFRPNQQRPSQPYNNQPLNQYKQPHQQQQQQHYQPPHHPPPNHHPQPHQQQPHPQQYQPPPLMAQAQATNKLNTNLRYIVIDGSNVAMTHGNHQVFSCKGIKICIDYFRRRGHREITAFVPQWRTHAPRPDYPIRDQHMLEELRKEGSLVFTPARRVPGKNIVCYDDKFVLRLAQETDGIVVSNDNYRDLWNEKREWRQIIEDRLLMFSFVGDIFMAPEDPLGRTGPILDAFLRKNNTINPDQYNRDQQEPPHGGDMGGWQPYNNRPNHMGPAPRPLLGMHQPPYQGRPNQGQLNTGQFQGRPLLRNPGGYQGQGQRYQGQGSGGQGQYMHNNQGPNHFNQNPQHRPRQRQNSQTEALKNELNAIFPDKEQRIAEVLRQYPHETDLTRLADFMCED